MLVVFSIERLFEEDEESREEDVMVKQMMWSDLLVDNRIILSLLKNMMCMRN